MNIEDKIATCSVVLFYTFSKALAFDNAIGTQTLKFHMNLFAKAIDKRREFGKKTRIHCVKSCAFCTLVYAFFSYYAHMYIFFSLFLISHILSPVQYSDRNFPGASILQFTI